MPEKSIQNVGVGVKERVVRHSNMGSVPIYVRWVGSKYRCEGCHRYFNERFTGLMPRRKYSELFRKEIVNEHHKGISGATLGAWRGVSAATILRWYEDLIERKKWATQQLW